MAPTQPQPQQTKQATLGRFFGKPGGSGPKPPPAQTKLSFATKAGGKRKGSGAAAGGDDPVEVDEEEQPKVKSSQKSEEDVSPGKEGKKRVRSAPKSPAPKTKDAVAKPDPEEDEDDEPAVKRPRKSRKVIEEDEEDGDEDFPAARPKHNKKNASPKSQKADASPKVPERKKRGAKAAAVEKAQEDEVMEDEPSPAEEEKPKKPAKGERNAFSALGSKKGAAKPVKREDDEVEDGRESAADSSEVEEELEEEDEDEEDKPEVAAELRKTVQADLTQHVKDPYPDWKPGEPVPYAALCTTFSLIELTTKRLVIMEYCSRFLRQVLRLTPGDLLPTVLLMINKLAPDYAGIELGIGESLIMKAIGETTGRSLAVIKQDQKEIGDLGLVAVKSRATQPTMFKPKALTVVGVHRGLMAIATVTGNGAQQRKVDGIKKLLSAADANSATGKVDIAKDKGGPSEAKFIIRFLEGKLRLGLAEKTVLVSLAQALICHEAEAKGAVPSTAEMEKAEAILKTVYSELPSYDAIIPAALEFGIMNLKEHCKLRPGIPLKPMLAKPTKAITEVLDRFENQTFTCEYKYDGERAQIHYVAKDAEQELSQALPGANKSVGAGVAAIFSRNSEDLSKKYPDILAKLHTWVKPGTKSFVLDCETVAWDVAEKKLLPFQQLMTRKKKDVKIEDVKVKVCVFAFDLLYLNGEPIVERPLRERRELLHESFSPVEGEFGFATSMDSRELDDIQTFLDESVKASCEGLMVKMLDGPESGYEPSKRSRNWLKIKKDYLTGIGDSLDLVVLGGYYGRGKRTSVYGAFLLACYNPLTESYETVCNIGTGFSEAALEELHARLTPLVIERPKPFYSHSATAMHQPDVWFEPRLVWEVRTADLTLSPRYRAAAREGVDPLPGGDRGVSLRFPRFVRVRDDKKPDEATTSRQVAEMYRRQESVAKSKGPAVDDDFEY